MQRAEKTVNALSDDDQATDETVSSEGSSPASMYENRRLEEDIDHETQEKEEIEESKPKNDTVEDTVNPDWAARLLATKIMESTIRASGKKVDLDSSMAKVVGAIEIQEIKDPDIIGRPIRPATPLPQPPPIGTVTIDLTKPPPPLGTPQIPDLSKPPPPLFQTPFLRSPRPPPNIVKVIRPGIRPASRTMGMGSGSRFTSNNSSPQNPIGGPRNSKSFSRPPFSSGLPGTFRLPFSSPVNNQKNGLRTSFGPNKQNRSIPVNLALPPPILAPHTQSSNIHHGQCNIWIVGDRVVNTAHSAFVQGIIEHLHPFWRRANLRWINADYQSAESIASELATELAIATARNGRNAFPHRIIFHVGRNELMDSTRPTQIANRVAQTIRSISRNLNEQEVRHSDCIRCKPRLIFSGILPKYIPKPSGRFHNIHPTKEQNRSTVNSMISRQIIGLDNIIIVTHDNIRGDDKQAYRNPSRDFYTLSGSGFSTLFLNWQTAMGSLAPYDQ